MNRNNHDCLPNTLQKDTNIHDEIDDPPPAYSEIGTIAITNEGLQTQAQVTDDGRVDVVVEDASGHLNQIFTPALQQQVDAIHNANTGQKTARVTGCPVRLSIVIHAVGSLQDIRPLVTTGRVLKEQYGHRVRLATHSTFLDLVESNGLEFFNIGGDPGDAMGSLTNSPTLLPSMANYGKKRNEIAAIVDGCWRSCIDNGHGVGRMPFNEDTSIDPFVADAIIANPFSFAHIHCAEKLEIPLHIMSTIPWSPTAAFPHPLANIRSSNTSESTSNCVSYSLLEMLTWQGIGDVINQFREKTLNLEPLSKVPATGLLSRLQVPHTYCWSPSLLPKPNDWGQHISVAGFVPPGNNLSYMPDPDLAAFLAAGSLPVYIDVGSVANDLGIILDAVRKTGQRALISKSHDRLSNVSKQPDIFFVDSCPPDWLFQRVSCAVHSGQLELVTASIVSGKPTVIVSSFGDQRFWGGMVANAGVGPQPIPQKDLTADKLVEAIRYALSPRIRQRAGEMGYAIREEDGCRNAVDSFHEHLGMDDMRCSILPSEKAVWKVKRTKQRLSAVAATLLAHEGLLDLGDLKPLRLRKYQTADGPLDPISGGTLAILGSVSKLSVAIAGMPIDVVKSVLTSERSISHYQSLLTQKLQNSRRPALTDRRASSTSDIQGKGKESTRRNSSGKAFMYGFYKEMSGKDAFAARKSSITSKDDPQHDQQPSNSILSDAAKGTGKSMGRIVGLSLKTPLDFTAGIAKGFRNAPRLYGDDTVRQTNKITGFQSGVKVAGKELGLGFYDGITGIFTQPVRGAKQGGVSGFVKGIGKGLGGAVLKPGAAIFGIPAYSFQGVYEEVQKSLGNNVSSYIFTTHYLHGTQAMEQLDSDERAQIIRSWHDRERQAPDLRDRWNAVQQRRRGTNNTSSSRSSTFQKDPSVGSTWNNGEGAGPSVFGMETPWDNPILELEASPENAVHELSSSPRQAVFEMEAPVESGKKSVKV
ncbi:hypothetical protein AWENTII_010790 [Aspergillus wentii]|nr:hypothetical protein MW887_003337 [Aspergillus wentii]